MSSLVSLSWKCFLHQHTRVLHMCLQPRIQWKWSDVQWWVHRQFLSAMSFRRIVATGSMGSGWLFDEYYTALATYMSWHRHPLFEATRVLYHAVNTGNGSVAYSIDDPLSGSRHFICLIQLPLSLLARSYHSVHARKGQCSCLCMTSLTCRCRRVCGSLSLSH